MENPYYIPLLPGNIYHLFNRAVGNEKLFEINENYLYFLRKYAEHTKEVCDTYSYCLLPNHFHLLIRIKNLEHITPFYKRVKNKELPSLDNDKISDFIMERFSNWLNGYTKAFNKMFHRKGALFIDYTKRIQIENDEGFGKLIHYIHANPVQHSIVNSITDWNYSSYKSLLSNANTLLLRDEVLKWFNGRDNFINFHKQSIDKKLQQVLE